MAAPRKVTASAALALISVVMMCIVRPGVCQEVSEEFSEGLPQYWQAVWDEGNGQHYYWNTVSGSTTWVRPWEFDVAELDDPDDLVSGTGIERLDCRILKDESLPVWPSAEELAEEAASADAYKAEELSRESQSEDPQVRDAYQFFLEMDKDGDGGLNEEEFMNALRQQSSDPTAWDNEDLSEIKQFFHEKELRGQPIMTWEEWRMLFAADQDHDEDSEDEYSNTGTEEYWDGSDDGYDSGSDSGSDSDDDDDEYDDGPLKYDEVTFRKWDLDGNGVLDREEVHKMLGRAEALSEVAAAADELLGELDLDLDESITFSEWVSSLY